MKTVSIPTAGAVAFWSAKPCKWEPLNDALLDEDLGDHMCNRRTPRSSLEMALRDYGARNAPPGTEYRVESLKEPGVNGYALSWVAKDVYHNSSTHCCSVKVDKNETLSLTWGYIGDLWAVQDDYKLHRSMCTGDAVGQVLVSLATKWLHGLTLKPTGGVYWIPDHELNSWQRATDAIERVSGSRVCTAAWEATPNTILEVREALTKGIQAECDKIRIEMTTPANHGDEFFDRRREAIASMLAQVEAVEKSLEENLQPCRDIINSAEQLVAMCAMSAL